MMSFVKLCEKVEVCIKVEFILKLNSIEYSKLTNLISYLFNIVLAALFYVLMVII